MIHLDSFNIERTVFTEKLHLCVISEKNANQSLLRDYNITELPYVPRSSEKIPINHLVAPHAIILARTYGVHG